MKKGLLILVLFLIAFSVYWFKFRDSGVTEGPKQQALKVNSHSELFNTSLDSVLVAYFDIKNAFVDADSNKVKLEAMNLIGQIDRLPLEELKKDTATIFESVVSQLNDIKTNAESITKQPNLTEMRQDFRMVSEFMYPLLKTIHYSGKTLYWQNCPMAFGDDKGANWISNTEEIVNPYLGKNHPEYKGTMLHCGEIQDSIKMR